MNNNAALAMTRTRGAYACVAALVATTAAANDAFVRPPQQQVGLRRELFRPRLKRPRPTPFMSSWDDLALDYETRVEPVTSSFVEEMLSPFVEPRCGRKEEVGAGAASDAGATDAEGAQDECDGRRTAADAASRPTLLDVGCGTGGSSLLAASAGFDVTAVDVAPAMVGRLSERISSSSSSDKSAESWIHVKVVDGQSLPSSWTSSFDFVASSFSVIFFPDPLTGFKEMERCLVPGGRAVVSGWGDRSDSPAFRIIPDAVRCVAPDLVSSGKTSSTKKPFVESALEVKRLMETAGFVDIEMRDGLERTLTVESPEEYYRRFALRSPPTRAMVKWMRSNMMEGTVGAFEAKVVE